MAQITTGLSLPLDEKRGSRQFTQAVSCAIAMNTVSAHIINKHFRANEFSCGIGIDCGKMLATKTGIRRNGVERVNYRNLVWLGRPANVASKLTDIAAKPAEVVAVPEVQVAYPKTPFTILSGTSNQWRWVRHTAAQFLAKLDMAYAPSRIVHKDRDFQSFVVSETFVTTRPKTPPILMTKAVWDGYRAANATNRIVTSGWFSAIRIDVPNYTGDVVGGDVIFTELRD